MYQKIMLASTIASMLLLPSIAASKSAHCLVENGGKTLYKGQCEFILGEGGSFTLRNLKSNQPIFGGTSDIGVYVLQKNIADVRGLTTDGVSSRWGEAKRSSKEKACWVGEDFKICAW